MFRVPAVLVFDQTTTGTYSSVISGTGSLTKSNTGTVTLTGTNTYSGGTTVSAGTLQGTTASLQGNITNNATVDFNQTTTGTYADVISGTGALTKNDTGTTTLSGVNTYTGTTTIGAGRLAVNGSITSATTVNSGGVLGGSGTITGNVTVNNGGTVAAGNSIGTLTITGDYTQAVGSTLEVEIQTATNPTTPGTDNDLVDVTGNVTLNGGTVDVKAASGTYTPNTEYQFLQYTGTLTGTFGGITDDLAFLDAALMYNSGNVSFVLQGAGSPVSFASVAAASNQLAVATYLDSINSGATGDLKTVLDALLLLTNSGAQNAYDQMSADLQGSIAQIGVQNASHMYSLISGHLRPSLFGNLDGSLAVKRPNPHASSIRLAHFEDENGQTVIRAQDDSFDQFYSPSRWNGWILGYGSTGKVSIDNSLDYTTGGTMFGVERTLDDTSLLGAYGSYGHANIDQDDLSRSADVDNYLAGVYLRSSDGFNYAMLSMAIGFDTYDTSRNIQFGSINRTARGDYDGWQGSVYLERGATMVNKLDMSLQPYAALQYIYQRQDSFTETGANALNLSVGAVDTNSLRSILGGRLAWNAMQSADGVTVIPELRAAWSHEFLNTSNSVNARFNTTGGAGFSVNGADMGRDWALLGTGLKLQVNEALSLFGDYDAQVNDRYVSHTGSDGLELQW